MKNTVDYKSRFRILKGGKISLVVSALLVGSSLVGTSAHAICDFEGEVCTSPVNLILFADATLDINSTGGLDIYGFGTTPALYVDGEDSYSLTLTNTGTISAVDSPDKTAIYVTNVSGLNFTNTIGAEVNATSDSGTAVGFLLQGDSGIALTDSSIVNSGAINVTGVTGIWFQPTAGISLHTSGDISLQSSSISNDGDIIVTSNGDATGLDVYSANNINITDSNITNSGNIIVQANNNNAKGISLYSYYATTLQNATISNALGGIIDVNANSNATGISITTGNYYSSSVVDINNSTISNSGTLNVHSSYSDANGILIYGNGYSTIANSTIFNDGNITVTSNSGSANGIHISSDYDITMTDSHIINDGHMTVSGEDSIGIAFGGDLTGDSSIKNGVNGIIDVNATNGYAYGIDAGDLSGTASITNEGTLNVLANYSGYGINTRSLENNASILNSNTITVTSTNSDAYGIYTRDLRNDAKIENSGTITATTTGKYGDAYGINTGDLYDNASIENSGTITATAGLQGDAYGIVIGDLYDNASILNSGTITAIATNGDAYGIYVNGDMYGTITNNAERTISATSVNGDAVGINFDYGMEIGSSLVNNGRIEAISTNGDTYGIYLDGDMYGTITNNAGGIISATSTDGDAVGVDFYYGMESSSALINSGTIEARSTTGDVYGIYFDDPMYGTITNNAGGVISATSTDGDAYGIDFYYGMESGSSLVNFGTIEAISTTGDAYGIYFDDYMDGTITNNAGGVISATSTDGNAYGIDFYYGMESGSSLVNNGTIEANSTTGYAYGIYTDSSVDGNITNNGTITATINGELDNYAYSLYTDSGAGVITNTVDGVLNGNLDVGGTLNNSGLISLPHNASAYVSNFNQTSTGILELGLLTDGTTTTYSQLETVNASFADNSTIKVNVLAASTNEGLLSGQTLENVVTANSSLTVDGTLNITDNSALLNFTYFTSASSDVNSTFINGEDGAIHLNIVEGQTILASSIAGDGNTNTQNAARTLDTIKDGDYPAMNPVFTALNTLPTDAAVAQAVESTTPVAATASAGATRQISNGVQSIVEMRQRANIGEGLNSGAEVFSEKNLWIKPFASFGTQGNKDGINGFDVNSAGIGFGMDAEYASNQKIGLALFYTKAYVDVNNMSQSGNLGVFSTLVYGNIPLLDDKTNFLYQLGYAWQKTDSNRYISLVGSTANADYTTNTASVDLKVIRDYSLSKKLLLQPMVGVTYRNFMSPDYTETGAGVLNLQSDKFSTDELIIGVGTLAHLKLDKDSKLIANVNVGYDTYGKEGIVTSSYAGASGVQFDTNGIDNGRWNYDLGLGYERDVAEGHNINFSYNYQGEGATFRNHVLSAKYVFSF